MGDTLGVTYLFRFHSSLKWTVSRFIQALIQHREPAGFEKNEQSRAGSLRAIEHQQNLILPALLLLRKTATPPDEYPSLPGNRLHGG